MEIPIYGIRLGRNDFLIPYVLFVILIGSTGLIEEMALGRAAKGGPIKAFESVLRCTQARRSQERLWAYCL